MPVRRVACYLNHLLYAVAFRVRMKELHSTNQSYLTARRLGMINFVCLGVVVVSFLVVHACFF